MPEPSFQPPENAEQAAAMVSFCIERTLDLLYNVLAEYDLTPVVGLSAVTVEVDGIGPITVALSAPKGSWEPSIELAEGCVEVFRKAAAAQKPE